MWKNSDSISYMCACVKEMEGGREMSIHFRIKIFSARKQRSFHKVKFYVSAVYNIMLCHLTHFRHCKPRMNISALTIAFSDSVFLLKIPASLFISEQRAIYVRTLYSSKARGKNASSILSKGTFIVFCT